MIPHTIVLEPGLRVYKIYDGYWFFGRPTVEEFRHDLRDVLQRCRPDWDISSTEQREAWAMGNKERFYPYGKTRAQVFAEQD
jgi:hypothetical protein